MTTPASSSDKKPEGNTVTFGASKEVASKVDTRISHEMLCAVNKLRVLSLSLQSARDATGDFEAMVTANNVCKSSPQPAMLFVLCPVDLGCSLQQFLTLA